ncbi:tetratricopeptide repeat protein [Tunicatimonas pelagia]|uniref:tetratricopeptide repeat protein n=1 Tax=Tunicatimonas pelagia TaxID=931531 RepID=UPI0026651C65|nr:tetratricopeptide repeat protein [Tunicatimonas pelagia]WKN44080.1 tetratricopeptide repeat protein [Tunicatimonas pelagia]
MNELDYVLIDRKIDGQLDSDEELRFSQKLKQDPEFAEAYELQKSAITALRSHQYQTRKQEVKSLYENVKARRQKQRKIRVYAVAAGAALLLLSSAVYLLFLRPATPQALYAAYYNPYPADPLLRGDNSSPYEQANYWYQQEDYPKALLYWQEALNQDTLAQVASERIRLLLANCYLQTEQPGKAIEVLQPLRSASDTVLRQYGAWYLALAHLKAGQPGSAKEVLQTIAQQPGLYQTTAHELLEKLPDDSDE